MDKVITYSLTEDFIGRLAGFIDERYISKNKDISKLAFIFGGRRPVLFLKRELAKRIRKGFLPPAFFSIEEFVEYVLSKKEAFFKISDMDACYLIYKQALKLAPDILAGRESFCEFLPWAREILGFIEQLDLEDVASGPLGGIQMNARIGYEVPESINILLGSIISLRNAYHDVLKHKKAYSRGLIYLLASGFIEDACMDEFEEIFFCNFFYLHKTEQKIFKTLYQKNKATFFFKGGQAQWPVLEEASRAFSCRISPEEGPQPNYNLSVYSAFDMHSEVCLARDIIKRIGQTQKTVIILPNPDNLIPLLSEIAYYVKDFNVSMGYPLNRSSVYLLFGHIFNAQKTKTHQGYYVRDYLDVLSHPLVKNMNIFTDSAFTRIIIHKIEDVLTGAVQSGLGGSLFIKPAEIEALDILYGLAEESAGDLETGDIKFTRDDLVNIVKRLHFIFFTQWEAVSDFDGFCSRLICFLDELIEKSPLDKYPLNLKIIERIFSIRQQLKFASFSREHMPKEDIFKIFTDKMGVELVSFSGSPLKGLQILGLLESRSLDFENVIIMDVNESMLPRVKVSEPLIPREIMASLGINRPDKEDQIQKYQFMMLISSAKNVHLIYREDKNNQKSRFIEELIWAKEKAQGSLLAAPVHGARFALRLARRPVMEKNKSALMVEFFKGATYSASSVNTYLNCPLKFYYQYGLGLQEREDLLDEPQGKDIGNFIHELLEETFAKFINRRPLIDAKFTDYFFLRLNKMFEERFAKRRKADAFLIKEVLDYRLGNFLNNEKKRDVEEVLSVENTFQGIIPLSAGRINFKARIDRIDRLKDKSILVLDYKTSAFEVMPKDPVMLEESCCSRESIKSVIGSFQLPLYVYFTQRHYKDAPVDAALYSLRDFSKSNGLKRLFKEAPGAGSSQKAMAIFLKALGFIVEEILNPDIPFVADFQNPRHCNNCQFFYLCR